MINLQSRENSMKFLPCRLLWFRRFGPQRDCVHQNWIGDRDFRLDSRYWIILLNWISIQLIPLTFYSCILKERENPLREETYMVNNNLNTPFTRSPWALLRFESFSLAACTSVAVESEIDTLLFVILFLNFKFWLYTFGLLFNMVRTQKIFYICGGNN